jgi:hypothetical protein
LWAKYLIPQTLESESERGRYPRCLVLLHPRERERVRARELWQISALSLLLHTRERERESESAVSSCYIRERERESESERAVADIGAVSSCDERGDLPRYSSELTRDACSRSIEERDNSDM